MMIRAARRDDIGAIAEIYGHEVLHGTGTFEVLPPSEAEMADRRARIVEAGYPYLVAEEAGILGYAHASAFRERRAFAPLVEDSVYVGAKGRGRGVGRALLSALVAEAQSRGFRQMVALVGDSENRASIALHEACGFTRAGLLRSVGWKHDRWLDVVLLQRALGPGDDAAASIEA